VSIPKESDSYGQGRCLSTNRSHGNRVPDGQADAGLSWSNLALQSDGKDNRRGWSRILNLHRPERRFNPDLAEHLPIWQGIRGFSG